MTTCGHESTVEISTQCFSHCVSPDDCDGAAHGCIRVIVECSRCGARHSENINGLHVETGPWGPSAAEIRETARVDAELRAEERRHEA